MGISRDDVIAAYEMILGRAPENAEVIDLHVHAHADRRSFGLSILASEEAQERLAVARQFEWLLLARMGLVSEDDIALLREFAAADRAGMPGFTTDFLGQRTRLSAITNGASLDGHIGRLPFPGDFHAEAAEWVAFLKVLKAARGGFVSAELGAGWGPWTTAAHLLARRLGLSPVKLYAVEADPVLFRRLEQHMADNDVPRDLVDLRQAVVTTEPGLRPWVPRDEVSTDYGARAPASDEVEDYRGQPARDRVMIAGLPLGPFLDEQPVWDLLHIDLQGIEEELCRAAMPALSLKVRHVIVATHSKSLDAGCFEAFHEAGWACLMNTAPIVPHNRHLPTLQAMTVIDGMQFWQNPRLAG